MPSFSKNEVILVRYPFSDLTASKVRPAIIVGATRSSEDYMIVPLTSKTDHLLPGEFALFGWQFAGLNLPSAVKRGLYTVHGSLILKSVGRLSAMDLNLVERSLCLWLGIHRTVPESE
jgi:mRNA interferase MazF